MSFKLTRFFSVDFFFNDWLYKRGNFSNGHVSTAFNIEGYFDNYNFTSERMNANTSYITNRRDCAQKIDNKYRWEFAFCPTNGFLGNPEPLIRDCELKLCFKRANPYNSSLRLSGDRKLTDPFELKDVVAITEYVSSQSLISYFDRINHAPIRYEFDDCDVLGKVNRLLKKGFKTFSLTLKS